MVPGRVPGPAMRGEGCPASVGGAEPADGGHRAPRRAPKAQRACRSDWIAIGTAQGKVGDSRAVQVPSILPRADDGAWPAAARGAGSREQRANELQQNEVLLAGAGVPEDLEAEIEGEQGAGCMLGDDVGGDFLQILGMFDGMAKGVFEIPESGLENAGDLRGGLHEFAGGVDEQALLKRPAAVASVDDGKLEDANKGGARG